MPKSRDVIRVGLVGAGYIAGWHAEVLKSLDGVKLVAVCDVSQNAAEELANIYGAATFTSVEAMIAAGVCDAVHILTPPHLHCDLAVTCLKAGLHILVEKPVALSADETKSINTAAEDADRIFVAGHNFMGLPSYQRLKLAKSSGQLGRITSAEFNWHFPLAPLRSGPFGLWLMQETRNLLLELGPHLFGFAVDLFGPPEIECLSLGKPISLPGGDVRPQSWRILARAGDVDLTFNLSLVETMDDRSVTVRGSGGVARLDYASDTLIIDRENAADIVLNPLLRQLSHSSQSLREGAVNAARQIASLNRKSPYGISFRGTFEAFYAAIRSNTEVDSRFSGQSALSVMTALDDVIKLLPEIVAPENKSKARPRKPKPTVLVIGGTGFLGRNLTRALVASGKDVRVLSRGKSGPFPDLSDRVETFSASLKDPVGLGRAMDGIETVYDLAKSVDTTWEDCLKNDVEVTAGIAKAALDAGVKRFIYTGTIASYDMSDPNQHITENTGFSIDMSDRNLYARSKAACEARLLELHKTDGLPVVIARPGIVVGHGGPLQHWGIGRWHGAGTVRIWGDGRNVLPFVLIDDVSDALIRMAEADGILGQSFNLIGEPMMSARDYFDAIAEALGARIRVRSGSLTGFYLADGVKAFLKRTLLRRAGVIRPSLRDWKSRAHFSPFENARPKEVLGWQPEGNRGEFIRKAITDADLFGF